MAEKQEAERRR